MNYNKTQRQAVKRLVVAFPATAEALAAEKVLLPLNRSFDAQSANCGRLISVPRSVSAGCGMAWKDELELKDKIETTLTANQIDFEGFFEVEFSEFVSSKK